MAALLAWLLEGKGHETGAHGRALRDFTFAGAGVRLYRGNPGTVLLNRLRGEESSEKNRRELAKKGEGVQSSIRVPTFSLVTV